jgi:hypothetical protein
MMKKIIVFVLMLQIAGFSVAASELPPPCYTLKAFVYLTNQVYSRAYKGEKSLAEADSIVTTEINNSFLKGTPEEYLNQGDVQGYLRYKNVYGVPTTYGDPPKENKKYNLSGIFSPDDLVRTAKKIRNQAMTGRLTTEQQLENDKMVVNQCLKRLKSIGVSANGGDYYDKIDYSKRLKK